jgi:hypothetical protein
MAKVLTLTQPNIQNNIYSFIGTDYVDGLTLIVKNTAGFNLNDYILLGAIGFDQTEIVQIASITDQQTLQLVSPALFPHPSDTTVSQIPYNTFRIYRSVTGIGGVYTLLAGVPLQVDELSNVFRDFTAQSPYSYQFSYYNTSNAQESVRTDEIPYTGYPDWALKSMQDAVLDLFGGSNAEDFITRPMITRWINGFYRNCQFKIQNNESPYDAVSVDIPCDGSENYDISQYQMVGIFLVQISLDGGFTFSQTVTPKDFRIKDQTGSISLYEYRIVSNTMVFSPPYPTVNNIVRIWYTTVATNLVDPTDVLKPPFQNNTEIFVDYCLMRAHEKDRKMAELVPTYEKRINAQTDLTNNQSWLSQIRSRIKQGNFAASSTFEDYINGF